MSSNTYYDFSETGINFSNYTCSGSVTYGINVIDYHVVCSNMWCSKCGSITREEWRFCPYCGEKL